MRIVFFYLMLLFCSVDSSIFGVNASTLPESDIKEIQYYAGLAEMLTSVVKQMPFVDDSTVELSISDVTHLPEHAIVRIRINKSNLKKTCAEASKRKVTQKDLKEFIKEFKEKITNFVATACEISEEKVDIKISTSSVN